MNPTFNNSLVLIMQSFFLGALFISLAVCFFLYKSKSDYFLAFVPMLALSVHQVEEYVFSPLLFGEYHHFLNWAFRNGMDISPIEVTLINLAPYVFFFPTLIFLVFFLDNISIVSKDTSLFPCNGNANFFLTISNDVLP